LRFLPRGWRQAACIAAIAILPSAGAADPPVTHVDIDLRQSGRTFVVDATFSAPVPPSVAWDVLTDFEHMDAFVPNLAESRIVARDGNGLTIVQYGVARFGPFAMRFESERRVTLAPFTTIRSTQLRGTMDKLDSTTTFASEGTGTRLTYHVEAIPGALFPDVVARHFLRHEIAEQFDAIVREMVRRHAASAPPSRPGGWATPVPRGDAAAAREMVRVRLLADATAPAAPAAVAWARRG
jgi:ribosome-associated toxin RatA of RatAB toxin-antitoxin module